MEERACRGVLVVERKRVKMELNRVKGTGEGSL
jgi:hypothetical protein